MTLSSVLDAFTPAASPPEASNIASDAVTRPVSSDSGPSPTSKAKEGVTESEGTTEVKECVVLCVDRSGSMQTPFECDNDPRTKDRTRLESVKQFFYGFRDQTTTYVDGSKHRLGLLSYDNNVCLPQALVPDSLFFVINVPAFTLKIILRHHFYSFLRFIDGFVWFCLPTIPGITLSNIEPSCR